MNPKISVIFPVSNEAFLSEGIESVLGQTFADFEFLIIEDGLKPEVESIFNKYHDERIIIIKLPINMGISSARNAGLLSAKAPYIAVMDCDDIASPNRFALQYALMESRPEVTVCGSNFIKIFTDGRTIPINYPESDGMIKSRLILVDSAIHNPTVMFRTGFVKQHGLFYDANFPIVQDYRFYAEIMRSGGSFYGLQEDLLFYRRHNGNASNSMLLVEEQKKRVREILLPVFFPDLTGEEIRSLLEGMSDQGKMTLAGAYYCLIVIDKALRENRTLIGEDRAELKRILYLYRDRLVKGLNKANAANVLMDNS